MGILKFVSDLLVADKLDKKVGTGAGFSYLNTKTEAENLSKNIQDDLIERKNDRNNNRELSEKKKNTIKYLKDFLDESEQNLNERQKQEIFNYIDKIDNSTSNTFDLYNDETKKYVKSLLPFFYTNQAMNELKENLSNVDDTRISSKNKEEIFNKINDIKNSKTTEEIKNKMKLLDEYLHKEVNVNVNFDYILDELEKGIKKAKENN